MNNVRNIINNNPDICQPLWLFRYFPTQVTWVERVENYSEFSSKMVATASAGAMKSLIVALGFL